MGFGNITAIYQDGTQKLVVDGVIEDNTSENRVTKVIINKSGLSGQDDSTAEVVFDVTAFDTFSDGTPIEFKYDEGYWF